MSKPAKSVLALTEADLLPLRAYVFLRETSRRDETWVREVDLPLKELDRHLIGTRVRLANGTVRTALLGNLSRDLNLNDHFLTIALFRNDQERFDLARYHDVDVATRGPRQLAEFLHLGIDEVFPIYFNLGHDVFGGERELSGRVLAEPSRRLSRSELIALAVP